MKRLFVWFIRHLHKRANLDISELSDKSKLPSLNYNQEVDVSAIYQLETCDDYDEYNVT